MLYVLHSIIGKETALHSIQCSSSTAAYEVRLFLELLLLALRAASAWITITGHSVHTYNDFIFFFYVKK